MFAHLLIVVALFVFFFWVGWKLLKTKKEERVPTKDEKRLDHLLGKLTSLKQKKLLMEREAVTTEEIAELQTEIEELDEEIKEFGNVR